MVSWRLHSGANTHFFADPAETSPKSYASKATTQDTPPFLEVSAFIVLRKSVVSVKYDGMTVALNLLSGMKLRIRRASDG